ncbi:flagellin [Rhodopirellula sp. JC740]|uniref:Flagellin n=1 Tax=Rhodopirellula halodulae TaxID=2894198 RepID=A0ABS8NCF7_9BACT|nr:flagellin [Rhodopirellula sp. JC740]MCC9641245.1 flagellin [Rhodopirellula sp. JC740]
MTRINTNVSSLVAQNRLQASNSDLQTALTRLSTGLRINSGADDPAGLIASEALRSEVTSLGRAISNTRRASQIISTADSALGQVSNLLNDVRGLVVEAANNGALSKEEIAANQLQIDSSLEAINRIAQTTTFQGRKLLDGSLDFVSTAGGVQSIRDINIDQANLGITGQIDVEVVVQSAATQASITTGGFSAAAQATTSFGTATSVDINGETIDVSGPDGFASIAFVDDINNSNTGAVAYDENTGVLTVTGNFTGNSANPGEADADASAVAIQGLIDALDGFAASGTAVAGTPAAPTGVTTDVAFQIDAIESGSEFNNVQIEFVDLNDGTADAAATAAYDDEQKILTVTYNSQAATPTNRDFAAISTAIDAVQDDDGNNLFTTTNNAGANPFVAPASPLTTGNTGGEVLLDDLVFQLNGADGAETFNFAGGTGQDQIAAAINLVSDSTGITADTDTGALQFTSVAYGTEALINIDVINEGGSGTFETSLAVSRATGLDISATVNGVEANGRANTLSINTSSLDLEVTVDNGSSTNFSFSITGGGALFQLGPDVTSNQQARLGIGSLSTGQLGGATGRLYELGSGQAKSLVNDVNGAASVIDEVIDKVTSLRGRLGAFQATSLESNLVSLNETLANLEEAESSIRDADFAQESANLTRAQILVQSGTNVLSLANQNPQNVLSLLG